MIISIFRNSIRSISIAKTRCILTIVGIAVGALCVSVLTIIGDIGIHVVAEEIDSFGLGSVLISLSEESDNGNKLYTKQLEIISQNPQVKVATPINTAIANIEMRDLYAKVAMWGVGTGTEHSISLELLHGRLIDEQDIYNNSQVCVVDRELAMAFYNRENIVGKTLTATVEGISKDMEVIGVVSSGGMLMQNMLSAIVSYIGYMPYTTMLEMKGENNFGQIAVTFNEGVDITTASEQLIEGLTGESLSPIYQVQNIASHTDQMEHILVIITTILSGIASISLVVSGLSIMTIMLITVKERTKEIGIKKAIGASNYMIMAEFFFESLLLSVIGVIIGGLLALFTGYILTVVFQIDFTLDYLKYIRILILAIIFGGLFGVYPAITASKLNPITALRYDG